jgi:hypothetical protein
MNPMLQQFLAVALPICVTFIATIWFAQWSQNKRFDDMRADMKSLREDMNRGFDQVTQRLGRIEASLGEHGERITRLEERLSPLARR